MKKYVSVLAIGIIIFVLGIFLKTEVAHAADETVEIDTVHSISSLASQEGNKTYTKIKTLPNGCQIVTKIKEYNSLTRGNQSKTIDYTVQMTDHPGGSLIWSVNMIGKFGYNGSVVWGESSSYTMQNFTGTSYSSPYVIFSTSTNTYRSYYQLYTTITTSNYGTYNLSAWMYCTPNGSSDKGDTVS